MARSLWLVVIGLVMSLAMLGLGRVVPAHATLADPLATSQAAQTRVAEQRASGATRTPTPATDDSVTEDAESDRPAGVPASATEAEVVSHVDGDKLRVRVEGDEREVLLLGVDAPEPDEGPLGECYAEEASEQLEELVPRDTTVYLEQDGDDEDSKDRLLRFLWIDDDGDAVNANVLLLREGIGSLDDRGKKTRHKDDLAEAESDAKDDEAGLWGEGGENHVELVAPTPTPILGEEPLPAAIGTTLSDGDVSVTLTSAYVAYQYGFSNPRGGYVFLVVEMAVENTDDEDHGYADDRVAAKDAARGTDFEERYRPTDYPLNSGDLSPGEYVSGLVILEVQETSSQVLVSYKTAYFGGEALYWLVDTGL